MARVSPLYYALTTPTRPFGVAARGMSRAVSDAAPMAMPVIDEFLQNPEVQKQISGALGQGAQNLGFGEDVQGLASAAGPMLSKLAPRLGAVFGSEALSGIGGLLGAPGEQWDPAVRRESAMMMMPMEGPPERPEHQNSGGGPVAGILGGATGAPIGQVAGAVEGMAMAPGQMATAGMDSLFSSAGATRALMDASRREQAPGATDALGALQGLFGGSPPGMGPGPFTPTTAGLTPPLRAPRFGQEPQAATGMPRGPIPSLGRSDGTPDPRLGGGPAGSPPLQANAMSRDLSRKVAMGMEGGGGPDLASILRSSTQMPQQPRDMSPRSPTSQAASIGELGAMGEEDPVLSTFRRRNQVDPAVRMHQRRMGSPAQANVGRQPMWARGGWGD